MVVLGLFVTWKDCTVVLYRRFLFLDKPAPETNSRSIGFAAESDALVRASVRRSVT